MRPLLKVFIASIAGIFTLIPLSVRAATITSITAEVTGRAYTGDYTNGFVRDGTSYDVTLAPGASTLSSQASNNIYAGASAKSSLNFTNSLYELDFSTKAESTLIYSPFSGYSTVDSHAALQFDVNFTLTEATLVSLLFDPIGTNFNNVEYDLGGSGYEAQTTVTLAQVSGSDLSVLYTRFGNSNTPSSDPDGDGIFYAAPLSPGDYRFSITAYSTSSGETHSNGTLQFSPVPEPAGALLIALGLASFLRRRRAVA